ncbi:DUF559 domain-containing protein [Nocardioides sp.]|uniref:DUF559 domain-containing protein n=1 Tax=Nocardioides sp. TaxID=35761 RepID=UPI0031FEEE7F|nr:hypothetical protein [Nocardioides sp.]MCW2794775.1 hypothetical protein [Nocardioides sp.]
MDVVEALVRLGGIASAADLTELTSPARVRSAADTGLIHRLKRGTYCLPGVEEALRVAIRLGGMASHLSAAQLHGWEVAHPPTCPWIVVPRNREVSDRLGSYVFWADLAGEAGHVTSPLRTVIDCGRRLQFTPALTVADSALRHRAITRDQLRAGAVDVRGKGAGPVREIAVLADGRAANAFESALRAIAIRSGLDVVPQQEVSIAGEVVHPDLVDVGRRLVLEADSWEFHATREAHDRDCWRYDELVLAGWTVLRFTWRQVMREPGWVRACLERRAGGANGGGFTG